MPPGDDGRVDRLVKTAARRVSLLEVQIDVIGTCPRHPRLMMSDWGQPD
jgi:hypothetical protein